MEKTLISVGEALFISLKMELFLQYKDLKSHFCWRGIPLFLLMKLYLRLKDFKVDFCKGGIPLKHINVVISSMDRFEKSKFFGEAFLFSLLMKSFFPWKD